MRSRLAAIVLIAGCGPSAGVDEACEREDLVTSGALVLVVGREWEECSPCDPETSHVLITLETTCEAGVEWYGTVNFIDDISVVNLATQERFVFDNQLGMPANGTWRVDPGEPLTRIGSRVKYIVTEPGDYSFRVELLHDLMAAEFEGSIE